MASKDIITAITKDIEFERLSGMSIEQREAVVSRKEVEIFKALQISDKLDYKDAVSTLLKSKYYLIIERLVLNGFTQTSIADYIKENMSDDEKLNKLTVSTLRSYIAKLKVALDKKKLLLKQYTQNPEKAEEFELRLNSAVNEIEIIGEMINLQKERITEMRVQEIQSKTHDKEIKNEIKLIVSLVDTSSKVKDVLGINQKDNRNAFEIYKDSVEKQYSRILYKDSSKRIMDVINSIINIPDKSNLIKKDELKFIKPTNAPDIAALIKTQELIQAGEIAGDKMFFNTPRVNSDILSVEGREVLDYTKDEKDGRDFREENDEIVKESTKEDIKIEEEDGLVVIEEDEFEDFE